MPPPPPFCAFVPPAAYTAMVYPPRCRTRRLRFAVLAPGTNALRTFHVPDGYHLPTTNLPDSPRCHAALPATCCRAAGSLPRLLCRFLILIACYGMCCAWNRRWDSACHIPKPRGFACGSYAHITTTIPIPQRAVPRLPPRFWLVSAVPLIYCRRNTVNNLTGLHKQ